MRDTHELDGERDEEAIIGNKTDFECVDAGKPPAFVHRYICKHPRCNSAATIRGTTYFKKGLFWMLSQLIISLAPILPAARAESISCHVIACKVSISLKEKKGNHAVLDNADNAVHE
jgi:hypothetical protein